MRSARSRCSRQQRSPCSLTQVGVHDKEVEVLLQVTAVFRNLSSEQVEHGSQQVVAETEVITALKETTQRGEKEKVTSLSDYKRWVNILSSEKNSGTDLSGGSRRGGGGGAGAVLQGEMSDEDDELGEGAADLSARALEQVLREAVGVGEENVVCKPIAYILTVSQQDAEGVIPEGRGGQVSAERTETEESFDAERGAELTSHWQDPELPSWCGNLC